ncbi:hypothetical protein D3C77_430910 [compost metagenome]
MLLFDRHIRLNRRRNDLLGFSNNLFLLFLNRFGAILITNFQGKRAVIITKAVYPQHKRILVHGFFQYIG